MNSSFSTSATALGDATSDAPGALASALGAAAELVGAEVAPGPHAARVAAPPARPAAHRKPRRLTFVAAIRLSI